MLLALLIAKTGTCDVRNPASMMSPVDLNSKNGIYLTGFGGLNFLHKPIWKHTTYCTSSGYIVGGAIGYQFCPFRIEGEFSYRNNTVNRLVIDALDIDVSGDIEQLCGFANAYLDIPVSTYFKPYVGLGFGYRHTNPGINYDQRSDISLDSFIKSVDDWGVYQAIGGLNFVLARCVDVQLEYRYMDGLSKNDCRNHTVDLGAKVHF
jgi:opacity protein-like surface antigen